MKQINNIRDLEYDDLNSNQHTERGMDLLAKSIEKNGIGRSILVDKNGKIIAGNGTAETLVDLGLEEVEVVQTHGDKLVVVQRMDLDLDKDKKARILAIEDNRINEVNLDWSVESLAALQEDGVELSANGLWSKKEFDTITEELKKSFEKVETKKEEEPKPADSQLLFGEKTYSSPSIQAPGVPTSDFIDTTKTDINKASYIARTIGNLTQQLNEADDEVLAKLRPELIDIGILIEEKLENTL